MGLSGSNGLGALPGLQTKNVNSTQRVVLAECLRAGQENTHGIGAYPCEDEPLALPGWKECNVVNSSLRVWLVT